VYVSAHTEAKMEIHIALAQQIGFIVNRKRTEETHFAHCKQFYRTESDAITVTETWEASDSVVQTNFKPFNQPWLSPFTDPAL